MTGKYIVFEGPDGAGKSTLASALTSRLNIDLHKRARQCRFPSDGRVGSLIRAALRGSIELDPHCLLHLYAADGINEEGDIKRLLLNGEWVVCDRHPTLSGRVFQLEHHPAEVVEQIYNASPLIKPSHLFVIDLPVSETAKRLASRQKDPDVIWERDDLGYMRRIRDRYLELAERFDATVLDGMKPTEELVVNVLAKVL